MSELAILGGQPLITEPWPKWPFAGQRERELVDEVLTGDLWGGTGLGPKIRELNERFAQYCGVRHGACVANGTVSMELALKAWGIGPGDEVIVPAFTFFATAVAVHNTGATAVYADLDPRTLNLDPIHTAEAITNRTRAIIPVHLGGHPADMDPLMELARRHGLKVLEDAAQAHGAIYQGGRKAGSLGHAASFSFQQSKNMQSGEGGIIVSDDAELVDKIHYTLSKFGRGAREKYCGHIHYHAGTNACYTEVQAAIALAGFERLEEQTVRRNENARRLFELTRDILGFEPFAWQSYCERHGLHLFMYRINSEAFDGLSRSQFLAALGAEGALCASLYPMPLYEQPVYQTEPAWRMRATACPVAQAAAREIGFFEHNQFLAEPSQIERLAEAMRKVRRYAGELKELKVNAADLMGSAVLKKARALAASR